MHPALLGRAGNQAVQTAVQAHFFRNTFPYALGSFESRNELLSNLVYAS